MTVLATMLIILRIVGVSRKSKIKMGGYRLTIELVVESGLLYATALTVASILGAFGDSPWRNNEKQIRMAGLCWVRSLPAMTVQGLCIIYVI